MLFKKIARLAAVALEFPEFEDRFKLMIHELSANRPNPNKPTEEELESFKRDYENDSKLMAVKSWKNYYGTGLFDSKHSIEDWASKRGWKPATHY